MKKELGQFFTERNMILMTINPLFLDELIEEAQAADTVGELHDILLKVQNIKVLEPAMGNGNFLEVIYEKLNMLQNVIRDEIVKNGSTARAVDIGKNLYGIEYDKDTYDEACRRLYAFSPAFNLYHGNALRTDWNDIVDKNELNYIVGNPPFIYSNNWSVEQREDMKLIWGKTKGAMAIDYISCWFKKASEYIRDTKIKVAFVSTNSLLQGRQLPVMRKMFKENGIVFHFAYPSFKWVNEVADKANVYVIIVGFANYNTNDKIIFSVNGETRVKMLEYNLKVNDYSVNKRCKPLSFKTAILKGIKPYEGGILSKFTTDEKEEFIRKEPLSAKYFRRIYGSKELLYDIERWCLYLRDVDPVELKEMRHVQLLLEQVKQFRSKCRDIQAQKYQKFPTCFIGDSVFIEHDYLAYPVVFKCCYKYIPLIYKSPNELITNANFMLPNADLIDFAFLTSRIHMVWSKGLCGRLGTGIRYSNTLIYNNFILPDLNENQSRRLEQLAQNILDVRNKYRDKCLAELYEKDHMPSDLSLVHSRLDEYVQACYGLSPNVTDEGIMDRLYDLYKKRINAIEKEESNVYQLQFKV